MSDVNENAAGGRRTTSGRSVATIERAADVLFLFTDRDRSHLGVTEIATELGISKAVVHRILTSLRERDLVVVDEETRRYSLGPAVLGLAEAYRSKLDVRQLAIETMRSLSEQTGETATLSIRSGQHRIYVDQVTPPREVKMTVELGRPFPLYAGSSSKAFLAHITPEARAAYLAEIELDPLTDSTIVDIEELRTELETIRARGYAVSRGERQRDAASVAAPIFDRGEPIAVISICGPLERFDGNVDANAALVVEATRALSERLGHIAP